jgi:hypothetical protein
VDPIPDLLLLRKSGSVGNRTRTSRSVARNSDHLTTEVVHYSLSIKPNSNESRFYIYSVHLILVVDKANLNHFFRSYNKMACYMLDARNAVFNF